MRILIADDERMARLSLESMLKELFPDAHEYEFAKNGSEVISRVREVKPDIVFLDIKMPHLNGIDALRECMQISPDTVYMILSGYADFDYAREALSLGAFEYLLKPIDINDLLAAMEKAMNQLSKRKRTKSGQFSTYAYRYFTNEEDPEQRELPEGIGNYRLYLFLEDANIETETDKATYQRIYNHYDVERSGRDMYSLFYLPTGELCLVTGDASVTETAYMKTLIRDHQGGTLCILTSESSSMETLRGRMPELLRLAPLRYLGMLNGLVSEGDLSRYEIKEETLEFARAIGTYLNLIRAGHAYEPSICTHELEEHAEYAEVYDQIDRSDLNLFLGRLLLINTSADSYAGFLEICQRCAIAHMAIEREASADIIVKIKEYVNRHYQEDVGLNTVADRQGISVGYLSRTFHERTGMRYIDYVTSVRIEQAKKLLLARKKLPIAKIAEEVGYQNTKHFMVVFKKYTGMTPKEFEQSAVEGS